MKYEMIIIINGCEPAVRQFETISDAAITLSLFANQMADASYESITIVPIKQ